MKNNKENITNKPLKEITETEWSQLVKEFSKISQDNAHIKKEIERLNTMVQQLLAITIVREKEKARMKKEIMSRFSNDNTPKDKKN